MSDKRYYVTVYPKGGSLGDAKIVDAGSLSRALSVVAGEVKKPHPVGTVILLNFNYGTIRNAVRPDTKWTKREQGWVRSL